MNVKKIALVALLCFFSFGSGFFARPAIAYDTVAVEINDQAVNFPDQKPYVDKITSRTYVPIRFVAESLGANVGWDKETKTVSIQKPNGDTIAMEIGSKTPKLNNIAMANELDAPAKLELSGRTMVPLRFISESMGLNVLWDGENRLVRISDKPFIATKELSAEQKARLMAYPYPVAKRDGEQFVVGKGANKAGEPYEVREKMIEYGKGTCAYAPTPLEWLKGAIQQKAVLKSNQRFITDADLCFSTDHPVGRERIRGILQTYNADGSITEQDIEYGFGYGTEFVQDGQTPKPSHWFDEYVTEPLSKAKRVQ